LYYLWQIIFFTLQKVKEIKILKGVDIFFTLQKVREIKILKGVDKSKTLM